MNIAVKTIGKRYEQTPCHRRSTDGK
jgi:hypothetical protein